MFMELAILVFVAIMCIVVVFPSSILFCGVLWLLCQQNYRTSRYPSKTSGSSAESNACSISITKDSENQGDREYSPILSKKKFLPALKLEDKSNCITTNEPSSKVATSCFQTSKLNEFKREKVMCFQENSTSGESSTHKMTITSMANEKRESDVHRVTQCDYFQCHASSYSVTHHSSAKSSSPQAEAFRFNFDKILKMLKFQGFESILSQLFARHIVSSEVATGRDVFMTLHSVLTKLEDYPLDFHHFLSILNKESAYEGLYHELLLQYQSLSPMKLKVDHCMNSSSQITLTLQESSEWKNCDIYLELKDAPLSIARPKHIRRTLIFIIEYDEKDPNFRIKPLGSQIGKIQILIEGSPQKPITFQVNTFRIYTYPCQGGLIENHTFANHLNIEVEYTPPQIVERPHSIAEQYRGKLSPNDTFYRQICGFYRHCIMSCRSSIQISIEATQTYLNDYTLTEDVKVYCIGYHSIVLTHAGMTAEAINCLHFALNRLKEYGPSLENYTLVYGRTHRLLAKAYRTNKDYKKAEYHIRESRRALRTAAPSCEVGTAELEFAIFLQNSSGSRVDRDDIRNAIERGKHCVQQCQDFERRNYMIPMACTQEALFHLRAFEKNVPTIPNSDLQKATALLESFRDNGVLTSMKGSAYEVREKMAWALISYHKDRLNDAIQLAKEAEVLSKGIDEHNLHIQDRLKFLKKMSQYS